MQRQHTSTSTHRHDLALHIRSAAASLHTSHSRVNTGSRSGGVTTADGERLLVVEDVTGSGVGGIRRGLDLLLTRHWGHAGLDLDSAVLVRHALGAERGGSLVCRGVDLARGEDDGVWECVKGEQSARERERERWMASGCERRTDGDGSWREKVVRRGVSLSFTCACENECAVRTDNGEEEDEDDARRNSAGITVPCMSAFVSPRQSC